MVRVATVRRMRRCAAVASSLLALGAAPVLADGPVTVRVANGDVGGQPWTVRVGMNFDEIVAELSLPMSGGDGGGITSGPITRLVPLAISQGSDLGARRQSEIDGYTFETVTRLRVRTAAGIVTVRPHRYPRRVTERWPQLAHARWFVRFFLPSARPQRVAAFDVHGHVLARRRLG